MADKNKNKSDSGSRNRDRSFAETAKDNPKTTAAVVAGVAAVAGNAAALLQGRPTRRAINPVAPIRAVEAVSPAKNGKPTVTRNKQGLAVPTPTRGSVNLQRA